MMWTTAAQTAFIGAFVGISTGFAIIPKPEVPPVELISVEFTPEGELEYHRIVRRESTVAAQYMRQIIESKTERRVPECSIGGWADYGPDERERQTFPLNAECLAVLEGGVSYEPLAAVFPIDGHAVSKRGKPFVWGQ